MTLSPMRGHAVVAGIGQTPFYQRGQSPVSERQLALEAIVAAAEDAGVDPAEIDGFAQYSWDRHNATMIMHELGTRELRWSSMVEGGGGGGIPAAIGMAAAAVFSGQADIVAVYRAIAEKEFGRFNTGIETEHAESHYLAHGMCVAAQFVGLRTQRFLHDYGIPREAMEALVLADYFHARNNPRARAFGNSVDSETYRASRMVVDPYRLYDCSRETDGAAAVIVMSAAEAARRGGRPVHVLGVTQGNQRTGGETLENNDDYGLAGFATVARRLWEQTGLSPADVDVAQIYENFSGAGLAAMMEHGLFTPADVSEVVTLENLTAPGGKLPVNTSGGCLAEGFVHGMEVVLEAIRQLRGESPNPVPGAEVCLVTGGPASTYVSSALFGTAATV